MHTSTVTVAILKPSQIKQVHELNISDIEIQWFSGSGAGGQHRNKHQNSCRVIHKPSNTIEVRQGRKREKNLSEAISALKKKLHQASKNTEKLKESSVRNEKIGSGQRGDKIITIRFQDNKVTNHINNKQDTPKRFMNGNMEILL